MLAITYFKLCKFILFLPIKFKSAFLQDWILFFHIPKTFWFSPQKGCDAKLMIYAKEKCRNFPMSSLREFYIPVSWFGNKSVLNILHKCHVNVNINLFREKLLFIQLIQRRFRKRRKTWVLNLQWFKLWFTK